MTDTYWINKCGNLEAEIERLRAALEVQRQRADTEREACAKVAEECVSRDYKVQVETAHYIAAAIRARKDGA